MILFMSKGGCGKTSLLAKSASLALTDWFGDCKPINIVRFLGTTPDSSALTPTLISICQQVDFNLLLLHRAFCNIYIFFKLQISYNFMLPFENIPDDLVPLTAHFKHLLTYASTMQPLFFFLDSIDQLTGTADKVSWLPTRMPPNCKVTNTLKFY